MAHSVPGAEPRHPLLSTLAARARRKRLRRGLTLRALAERCGLSVRFLAQVEAGDANISVLKLASLAAALGTTPATLIKVRRASRGVVCLLGLRGAGKTTIGRRLAQRLKVPFVELDRRVEEVAGLSLPEIFSLHGETYYRRLERRTLKRVLAEDRPLVLAAGGGLVSSEDAFALLRRRAVTFWLRATAQDLWNRVLQQGDRRPMAHNPEAMADLRRLLSSREAAYAKATHTIDTSRLSVDDCVRLIEARLGSS
jgi:XRE family aerobic/anaerobic benzoate catabolism transcriptional regulator